MDLTQAQIDVVRAAIATFPAGEWQAAILDFELLEMPDGFDTDYVGVVLMSAADGGLEQEQFFLDHAARVACTNLYVQRQQDAGDVIAGFALRIEQPGTYRFDFKREAKRLNGVWDTEAEQYLDNCLSHYAREQAGGNPS